MQLSSLRSCTGKCQPHTRNWYGYVKIWCLRYVCQDLQVKWNTIWILYGTKALMLLLFTLSCHFPWALVHNSYKLIGKSSFVPLPLLLRSAPYWNLEFAKTTPIAKSSITFALYKEYYCSTHQQKAWSLLFSTILHSDCFDVYPFRYRLF